MSRNRYKELKPKDAPSDVDGALVAQRAADVDQANLEPGCKPDDLVAWSEKHQLFTRLPLASLDSERVTREISEALDKLPPAAPIVTPARADFALSPSNARRLDAAMELLHDEFVRLAQAKSHGRLTVVIPFADGDAQDIICTPERRVRMT